MVEAIGLAIAVGGLTLVSIAALLPWWLSGEEIPSNVYRKGRR
jgi:hypothetical protein